ncbi:MucBP domain-containing protein [Levilactobacillus sp. 244-2]|uniref:MucBP domain-containing protein n=1 Tax=Levilactobacillus sp. 244-2 TaxID=2799569 RepID=UPI0019510D83|nr:MucBP domain-containing protein [Levilactobacillus sp. 244-2]
MRIEQTEKRHYKMYKKGKLWVTAGIISGAVLLGAGTTAQASVEPGVTESASTVTVSTEKPVEDEVETTDSAVTDTETGATEMVANESVSEETTTESPATDSHETEQTVGDNFVNENATTNEQSGVGAGSAETEAPVQTPVGSTRPVTDLAESVVPATESEPATTTMPATTETVVAQPATAVTPATTVTPVNVTVPEIRPAEVTPVPADTMVDTLGADLATAAVPLVQTELGKTTTMKLTHTKETATIDLWMPNKKLQQVILQALQELKDTDKTWDSVADITQEDMALIKNLSKHSHSTYIDGKTAYSLEGLQYAVNLESANFGGSFQEHPGAAYGDIVDITPLANLQHLTALDLQYNRIKDITPLATLQNIEEMWLFHNNIQDFSPLKGKVKPSKFNCIGQLITLDPVVISDKDREGHLQIACTTIDGEVVQLVGKEVLTPLAFYNNDDGFTYQAYFAGGTAASDGQGGLYYSGLQDQKPGATAIPGHEDVNVDVQPYYHYMIGVSDVNTGAATFIVVQPYTIAQSAADVTVHYVDETGKDVAPAQTLKPGLVGEAYTTTPLEVSGYVLQETPENATGTYGEAAIDVTYVYAEEEADAEGNKPGGNGNQGSGNTNGGGTTTTPDGPGVGAETPDSGQDGDASTSGNETGNGHHPGGTVTGNPAGDGDVAVPGTPGGLPTGGANGTGTGVSVGGQASQLSTGSYGHQHQYQGQTGSATTANLTESEETGDQVLSNSVGSMALPQTNDSRGSIAWGVALLVSLLSLCSFKRKTK